MPRRARNPIDDGIYQLIVVTQAPSQPPVVQIESFTIATLAPAVDLALLNPKSFGDRAGGPGASAVSSKYPGVGKPGKVQVSSSGPGSKVCGYSPTGAAPQSPASSSCCCSSSRSPSSRPASRNG